MSRQNPLFRLSKLLARQLSKPVVEKIKRFAVANPWFRHAVCARTGRLFHILQLRLRLWMLALHPPRTMPPLSEQAALDAGANVLGELALFGLGGLVQIVISEIKRQANKQDDKLLNEESRWLALLLSLEELRRELALQQKDIERLHAMLRLLAPLHTRALPHPGTSASPPASASPTPPTSEPSTTSTSERSTTSVSEPSVLQSPPTSHCPPPSTSDCSPPTISECLPSVTSECSAPVI